LEDLEDGTFESEELADLEDLEDGTLESEELVSILIGKFETISRLVVA
jgi:hypothetical protein